MSKSLAIVTGRYPLTGSAPGAAKARRYARIALGLGLRPEVFAIEPQSRATPWQTTIDEAGIPITRVSPHGTMPARLALSEALQARGPFDAVLAMQLGRVGQPAIGAARQWQVPSIAHAGGSDLSVDVYDPQWAAFVTWSLANATAITAASTEIAGQARGFGSGGTIAVWPESVDPDRFFPQAPLAVTEQTMGWPPAHLRIGTLERPQDAAGLEEVLRAFSAVRKQRQDAQLVLWQRPIGGSGQMLDEWRRQDPLSAGRVVWLADAEETDLPGYFALLHQLWLPWRQDLGGAGLLQAMACEVPVIATAVGSHGEWLRPGDNGIVVPIGDADALARASLALAAVPDDARQLGARARRGLPEAALPAAEAGRLATGFQALGLLD